MSTSLSNSCGNWKCFVRSCEDSLLGLRNAACVRDASRGRCRFHHKHLLVQLASICRRYRRSQRRHRVEIRGPSVCRPSFQAMRELWTRQCSGVRNSARYEHLRRDRSRRQSETSYRRCLTDKTIICTWMRHNCTLRNFTKCD